MDKQASWALRSARRRETEQYIFNPSYGVHTRKLQRNGIYGTHAWMVKKLMPSVKFDEVDRGTVIINHIRKTVTLVPGYLWSDRVRIPTEVVNIYKERFPGYEISDAQSRDIGKTASDDEEDNPASDELARLINHGNPFTIYRGVGLSHIERFKVDEAGEYWTWDEKCAQSYYGSTRLAVYVIRAEVWPSQVNWDASYRQNCDNEWGEKEITLNTGTELTFTGWKPINEKDWREPWVKTITASSETEPEPEGYENLRDILLPEAGGCTGPEKERKLSPTASVFISPYGSYRFVKTIEGKVVAALQIMAHDKKKGIVGNAYTMQGYRRQGLGTELIGYARKMFKEVVHSKDLSGMGKKFVDKVGKTKTAAKESHYPASQDWIARAREFIMQKWAERAAELGRPEPADLAGACKFASQFAQTLFGGELRGNWNHQFMVLDGKTVDLTAGSKGSDDYSHDKKFWNNREHRDSMESCKPRVDQWVREFKQRYPIDKTAAPRTPKPNPLKPKISAVPYINVGDVAAAIDKAIKKIKGTRDPGITAFDWLRDCLIVCGVGMWGNTNPDPQGMLADYVTAAHYNPNPRYGCGLNLEFAKGFIEALNLRRHQSMRELVAMKDRMLILITHERVHAYQHSKMKEKFKENDAPHRVVEVYEQERRMNYLARPAEIGAYAVHAVYELRQSGMSDQDILKYIRSYKKPESRSALADKSVALRKYTNMDDYIQAKRDNPGDVDPEFLSRDVLRELIRKMVQYVGKTKTASPDFGYTHFNDRDTDLGKLEWVTTYTNTERGRQVTISAKEYCDALTMTPRKVLPPTPEGKWVYVAMIRCNKSLKNPECLMIETADVFYDRWKGTGLGQIMYDKAIEYAIKHRYDYFCSDLVATNVSDEAKKAWKLLETRYHVTLDDNLGRYVIDLQMGRKTAAPRTPKPKSTYLFDSSKITSDGFVTPDGRWIECSRQDHSTVAMQLGYKGKEEPYVQAIRDGYVRVVVDSPNAAYMQFRDGADAQRRAGSIMRCFPVGTERIGIEIGLGDFGAGKYIEYDMAEAEEKYPSGTFVAEYGKGKRSSAEPKLFYRGTNPGDTRRIRTGNDFWDSLLFVTDDPKHARNYGSQIDTYQFKPGAKILYQGTGGFHRLARLRKNESMLDFCARATLAAKEAGYDAVHFTLQGDVGTAVINRDSIEKVTDVKTAASPTMSPAFQSWFAGSKVVDKDGNPLRCYHGTRSSVDFDEFSVDGRPQVDNDYGEGEYTTSGSGYDPTSYLGAHFAQEHQVANKFALPNSNDWMSSRYDGEQERPRVIPVFLSIKNPKDFGSEHNLRAFIYSEEITGYADDLLTHAMEADGIEDPLDGDSPEAEEWLNKYSSNPAFRTEQNQWLFESYRPEEGEDDTLDEAAQDLANTAVGKLKQQGFDGIRYKNEVEGGISWVVFSPNQVKSAIGNSGSFDPKSPSITASTKTLTLYRGVNADGKDSIRPSDTGVYGPGVYFYDNPMDARAYAGVGGGIIVAQVNAEDAFVKGTVAVVADPLMIRRIGFIPTELTLTPEDVMREADKYKTAAVKLGLNVETGYDSWQDKLVDNPKFQAWFKGSKVTDSHGRPLMVYHGTNAEFNEFSEELLGKNTHASTTALGFFFTDRPAVASSFGKAVFPVYLKMEKPFEGSMLMADPKFVKRYTNRYNRPVGPKCEAPYKQYNKGEDPFSLMKEALFIFLTKNTKFENLPIESVKTLTAEHLTEARKRLMSLGFDGIIVRDTQMDGGGMFNREHTFFIAFSANQIKSAIGNNGEFSPEDKSITAAKMPKS